MSMGSMQVSPVGPQASEVVAGNRRIGVLNMIYIHQDENKTSLYPIEPSVKNI